MNEATDRRVLAAARAASVLAVLAGWALLSWLLYSPRMQLFPSPWAVAVRCVQLLHSELGPDIAASLGEAAGGWVIGSLLGIAAGALIGLVPAARFLLRPVLDFLRFISPLAWVPLAILWFGIGYWSKASIIALVSFFIVVVNAAHGMAARDRDAVKAARALRLRPVQRAEVVLMQAMPDILLGLRVALGAAWGGVVLSELVAGDVGLGAMESFGGQSCNVTQIMVGMLVLAVMGYAANLGFVLAQRRLFPWITSNRVRA